MLIKVSINLLKSIRKKKGNIDNASILNLIHKIILHDKIVNTDFKSIQWDIIKTKFQGIMIDELKLVVVFARPLSINDKVDARNTYLSQPFEPAYRIAKENKYGISVSINPIDLGKKPNFPNFILLFFKTLLTLNIKINDSFDLSEKPFENLEQFLRQRNESKNSNRGNYSTYYEINDEEINIYGKLEGANFADTLMFCQIIVKLSEKKNIISFFHISYDENEAISSSKLKLIENLGINVNKEKIIIEQIKSALETEDNEVTEHILKRNQPLFKRNIFARYSDVDSSRLERCFCCDYSISENLIGAHIHRVIDIKNEYTSGALSKEEALDMLINGDNGFFLCPNHDKEFEKGYILFDINKKHFILNEKFDDSRRYERIKKSINDCSFFKNVTFSEIFINNVNKHISRVTKNNRIFKKNSIYMQ